MALRVGDTVKIVRRSMDARSRKRWGNREYSVTELLERDGVRWARLNRNGGIWPGRDLINLSEPTPPRRHPRCSYCGVGGDGAHVCGVCHEAGIDGPVIRGTGGRKARRPRQ